MTEQDTIEEYRKIPADVPPDDLDGGGGGDGGDDSCDWLTIATFWTAPEAHLARLKLEAEDIPCVILDENLIATDWFLANAAGGIKLKVPAEEAPRAAQLLGRGGDPADVKAGAPPLGVQDDRVCPRCGSNDTYRESLWRPMSLAVLAAATLAPILFFFLPWVAHRPRPRKCMSCGHAWGGPKGFPISSQTMK